MTFHLTTTIAAPPQTVFDFVSDLRTMPRWYSAVESVHLLEGATPLTAIYRVRRRLPTGNAENEVQTSAYVPSTEVAFTSITGPTPFTYRYRVSPISGRTQLQLDGSITTAGLPGPAGLLGPFAEQLFKRGMQDNLQQLASIIERASRFADQ
ncbi:SRPBCC family protein [Nocardioides sp. NPDC127503]|uniref:SRPBCC family protein n=1 Tax=Nocardioides sp. NPDC127503 TaxID=3154516 RepID=UPI0033201A3D